MDRSGGARCGALEHRSQRAGLEIDGGNDVRRRRRRTGEHKTVTDSANCLDTRSLGNVGKRNTELRHGTVQSVFADRPPGPARYHQVVARHRPAHRPSQDDQNLHYPGLDDAGAKWSRDGEQTRVNPDVAQIDLALRG